jgi:hypothetical protein
MIAQEGQIQLGVTASRPPEPPQRLSSEEVMSLRSAMLCHSDRPITLLPSQWATCGIDLDVLMLVRGYGAYF